LQAAVEAQAAIAALQPAPPAPPPQEDAPWYKALLEQAKKEAEFAEEEAEDLYARLLINHIYTII